jgi:hypothetical protein
VPTSLCYDTLIVAAGSEYSYFGHDEWAASAPEVKSLESAVAARSRIFTAFEKAEVIDDEEQQEWSSATVTGATEEARRPSGDAGAAKGKSHLSRHAGRGRALAFTRNGSSGRSRRDECVRGKAITPPAVVGPLLGRRSARWPSASRMTKGIVRQRGRRPTPLRRTRHVSGAT